MPGIPDRESGTGAQRRAGRVCRAPGGRRSSRGGKGPEGLETPWLEMSPDRK